LTLLKRAVLQKKEDCGLKPKEVGDFSWFRKKAGGTFDEGPLPFPRRKMTGLYAMRKKDPVG